jgi:hypothetical protein
VQAAAAALAGEADVLALAAVAVSADFLGVADQAADLADAVVVTAIAATAIARLGVGYE